MNTTFEYKEAPTVEIKVETLKSDIDDLMKRFSDPIPTQIITKDYDAKIGDQRIAHISDAPHTVKPLSAYDARNRRFLWINAGDGELTILGEFLGAMVSAVGVMTNPKLKKGEAMEFFSFFVPNGGNDEPPVDLQIDGVSVIAAGKYKYQIVNLYNAKYSPNYLKSEFERLEGLVSAASQSAGNAQTSATNANNKIDAHSARIDNPHNTTKSQIGLDKVDNTKDVDKPVSTAQQTAIDSKEPKITVGTVAQYFRGDKTWKDFAGDVRSAPLTGVAFATNAAVLASDTVLTAIGKLQAQINALNTNKVSFGIASVNLSGILGSGSRDVTVTFAQPMPNTNYDVAAFIANTTTLSASTGAPKTKTTTSVVIPVTNSSILTLSGSCLLVVIVQGK